MIEIIEKIKKNKTPCYFISPHLDDAVFSAGSLMQDLSNHTKVVVINVFTMPSKPPYTLSAKRFLRQCKYKDPLLLFAVRQKEDAKVLQQIGTTVINLPYEDSIWRKLQNPNLILTILGKVFAEFIHIYPIYRLHIQPGKISAHDKDLMNKITEDLTKIINPESFIFCPVGIGQHNDHLLVREVVVNSFNNVIMWTDFPYILNSKTSTDVENYTKISLPTNKNIKKRLIKGYKAQVKAIFENKNIEIPDEVFYFPEYMIL